MKKTKENALTLVETLVSLAIVTTIIVISSYVITSFSASRAAQVDTQGQAFARSYFDVLKALWVTPSTYTSNRLPTTVNSIGVEEPYPPPATYSYSVVVKPSLGANPTLNKATILNSYTYTAQTLPLDKKDVCTQPVYLKNITLEVTKTTGSDVKKLTFSTEIAEPTRPRATC